MLCVGWLVKWLTLGKRRLKEVRNERGHRVLVAYARFRHRSASITAAIPGHWISMVGPSMADGRFHE